MAFFQPIFTLDIEHTFFADGRCNNLIFVPTSLTQRVLQQYQLLVKENENGFSILADQEFLIPFDDEAVLRFEVFSTDPYFGFYTAEAKGRTQPLYCTTKNITADNTSLVISNEQPAESERNDIRRAKPGTKTPLLVVDVELNSQEFLSAQKNAALVACTIQFNTRDIYWKYYFFGELAKLELDIHDLGSLATIEFYPSDEPVARNGKAFISQHPIAMSSEPKQRFQLKDKNNSGKILIKRLPNAGVNLIGKSRDLRGQQILVAEIYVNQ